MRRTKDNFTQETKLDILKRDKFHCIYCGAWADVVDHVWPVNKGGRPIKANGVACCNTCNNRKSDYLDPEEASNLRASRIDNRDYVVEGIVYLTRVGEDMSWLNFQHLYVVNLDDY